MSKTREDSDEYTCYLFNTPTLEQLNQKRFSEMTPVFFSLNNSSSIKMPKSLKILSYSILRKQVRYKYRFLTEVINKRTFLQFFEKL